jgi:hypothetical protein
MRFQLVITPTLPSPLEGEGKKLGFRMETILAKKEGVMQRQKKTCPLSLLFFPYYFSQSGGRDRFLLADFFLIC